MSWGLRIFTLFHVALSLAGILAGFVVVFGFTKGKQFPGWNAWFLLTTITTSVTGFLFPFHKLLPSHVLGMLSLIALAFAVLALYKYKLVGAWRRTYAVTSVIAVYLNVFVLIFQLFQKVPALKALAPTQSEAPFKIAQLFVLVLFLVFAVLAVKRSGREQLRTT